MASVNCSNCAAALVLPEGASVARCHYCGTDNRLGARARERGASPALLMVAIGAVVMLAGVGGAIVALAPAPSINLPALPVPPSLLIPPEIARTIAELPTPPPRGGVGPSALGTIAGRGWVPVKAPPMTGSPAAFDPLVNLPWAIAMAQAWSTDARLESLYIDGVRADGALDVSARDDWDVDYRFFSPTLRASARAMATVSEGVVHSELRLRLSEGELTALLSEERGTRRAEAPVYAPRCTFAGVMDKAGRGGLEPRPTYGLMLTWVSGRWRWHVSAKDGKSVSVYDGDC